MTATNQQPVAEICSASHDDAQFGERAIKPLCDISGFEYGTPLYAGAAPAAVAPQGEEWRRPTTYLKRFGDAIALLCHGRRPEDQVLSSWLDGTSDVLQQFAVDNGPAWAQGIGLIDAATIAADQPTEGVAHEMRAAAAPALEAPAAPESAPWCPDVCPITGRPFFMWITHHETGVKVPTYGGPFDSYTLPVKGSDGSFECERYDHDRGGWLTDEIQDVGLTLVDDQSFIVAPDHPRYTEVEEFANGAATLAAAKPGSMIAVPFDLIASACSAIDKKRDAPKTLAELRRYTTGDLSRALEAPQGEYPHEQMDAMALARYKVVPSHASMLWSHAVVAGDGAQQLYVGREVECQNMARKFAGAFLDGAFAFHSMAAAPTAPQAPAQEAPAAPTLVGDEQADSYLAEPGRLATLARSHPAGLVRALARAALAAAPQAPAAQVIENLLQLARIVNTAVEDWGETKEDDSLEVIFHKEEADKLEEILEFFDSLPDAPESEGVILSGPSRAARVLRAQAAPAAPAVDVETIEDAARFRAIVDAALTDDEAFDLALRQYPELGDDATIDDVRAMFDAARAAVAAQAKEGGDA
ncbi:hypothetical protein [Delftia tsuruhatensis]|uniref:hypothetical protein n=1 Tax=Delftia tsuruhatensis TaxID=180282 RepID=UPI000774555B|nr:hypothetical protein [Delftia tsuruhatensis]SFB22884.1 hypothetical protein SAMN05444579_103142 [Delftia tsuruhatensis]